MFRIIEEKKTTKLTLSQQQTGLTPDESNIIQIKQLGVLASSPVLLMQHIFNIKQQYRSKIQLAKNVV